jgi:hypothetical protein
VVRSSGVLHFCRRLGRHRLGLKRVSISACARPFACVRVCTGYRGKLIGPPCPMPCGWSSLLSCHPLGPHCRKEDACLQGKSFRSKGKLFELSNLLIPDINLSRWTVEWRTRAHEMSRWPLFVLPKLIWSEKCYYLQFQLLVNFSQLYPTFSQLWSIATQSMATPSLADRSCTT